MTKDEKAGLTSVFFKQKIPKNYFFKTQSRFREKNTNNIFFLDRPNRHLVLDMVLHLAFLACLSQVTNT